jgi:hypothetical protein
VLLENLVERIECLRHTFSFRWKAVKNVGMRALSIDEIDEIISSLDIYSGKPLQSIATGPQDLILGFWEGRRMLFLWLDLDMTNPILLPMLDLPLSLPKARSPLNLFLNAHFSGRPLLRIERRGSEGRIVHFVFEEDAELEFRMIPRGVNVIARAASKQISWKSVLHLSEHVEPRALASRSLREMLDEWKAKRVKPSAAAKGATPKNSLAKKLEGLKRSLAKVNEEIEKKSLSPYRRLGEWLVEHQTLTVPEEFAPLIEARRKLAWNIEQCFHKAKEAERKLEGTIARRSELESEVASVEKRIVQGVVLDEPEKRPPRVKGEAPSSRTLNLPNAMQVSAGKSARDNLSLLRRAHAWDLWLHVKDQPSAHAILTRAKGAKVSEEILRKSAQWLIRMSLGSKFREHIGEKFQILSAECRHVSPIKGDRLGRVTYRNEKVILVKFEG